MQINAEAMSKTKRFEEIALVHMDSVHRYALDMARNESDAKAWFRRRTSGRIDSLVSSGRVLTAKHG